MKIKNEHDENFRHASIDLLNSRQKIFMRMRGVIWHFLAQGVVVYS